jgi:hypothetical protein
LEGLLALIKSRWDAGIIGTSHTCSRPFQVPETTISLQPQVSYGASQWVYGRLSLLPFGLGLSLWLCNDYRVPDSGVIHFQSVSQLTNTYPAEILCVLCWVLGKTGAGLRGLTVWGNQVEGTCHARRQWFTPIILATQEAAIRRITVQSQSGKVVQKTLS